MLAKALADDLGIGRTTLWRWTQAGLLQAPERRGRTSHYTPAAVAAARNLAEASR